MSDFAKELLPLMVKIMQELPVEKQGFIVGYAQCEADRLKEVNANE